MKQLFINITLFLFIFSAFAELDPNVTVVTRFKTPLEIRRALRAASEAPRNSLSQPVIMTGTMTYLVTNKPTQKVTVIVAKTNSIAINKTNAVAATQIKITGSTAFKSRIDKALALLKEKDNNNYIIVLKCLNEIKETAGAQTYVIVDERIAYFAFVDAVDVFWCAAGLVHEATHVALKDAGRQYWGTGAELLCMREQSRSLELIGAPQEQIRHVRSQDGTHWMNK